MSFGMKLRWKNYFMVQGKQFQLFWREYLSQKVRDILYVSGLGFDSRSCLGYEKILSAAGKGRRDYLTIELDEGPNSPSLNYHDLVEKNEDKLKSLIPEGSIRINKRVRMISEDGSRRIGSSEAFSVISDSDELKGYSDIIIDISALPRGIYFPLIGKVLTIVDLMRKENKPINLHVIVCENVDIDRAISADGIAEDASYVRGFTGELQSVTHANKIKIWIPIIGENQEKQLVTIADKVKADEITPLIPMPSKDPRRGDNLILEYRRLLFDRLLIDPKNVLYGHERNPFEVYAQLCRTIDNYQNAFAAIGECQIVLSASSSKLISIGALLTAYEFKKRGVAIINVESMGYKITSDVEKDLFRTEFFSLWIAGECYD